MSRSGYSDDLDDQWDFARWRGIVANTIKGKRGQAFLKEMLAAFDALPEKKLIAEELATQDGAFCAIGAVGKSRGVDMNGIDPEDVDTVANLFGISRTMVQEIVYMNDEAYPSPTPEERFTWMRKWVEQQIRKPRGSSSSPAESKGAT